MPTEGQQKHWEVRPQTKRHIRRNIPSKGIPGLLASARNRIALALDPFNYIREAETRFLEDEMKEREGRLNIVRDRGWSPENAALAIWEAEEDRRRGGERGLYAWDSFLRSPANTPHLAASPARAWKCNALLANAFNFDGQTRIDIGRTKTTPPRARDVRLGKVRQFQSAGFDLSKARPGMVITVDEGPGSGSDHVGIVGYDPEGSGRLGVFNAAGDVDGATHAVRKDEPRRNGVVWDSLDDFQYRFSSMPSAPETRFQLFNYVPSESRQDAKGGDADRFSMSRNFLATDKVPDSIFGIPVVADEGSWTPEDLEFFKEHPEAGGYYDMGEGTPEDGTEEGEPVQADEPRRNKVPDKVSYELPTPRKTPAYEPPSMSAVSDEERARRQEHRRKMASWRPFGADEERIWAEIPGANSIVPEVRERARSWLMPEEGQALRRAKLNQQVAELVMSAGAAPAPARTPPNLPLRFPHELPVGQTRTVRGLQVGAWDLDTYRDVRRLSPSTAVEPSDYAAYISGALGYRRGVAHDASEMWMHDSDVVGRMFKTLNGSATPSAFRRAGVTRISARPLQRMTANERAAWLQDGYLPVDSFYGPRIGRISNHFGSYRLVDETGGTGAKYLSIGPRVGVRDSGTANNQLLVRDPEALVGYRYDWEPPGSRAFVGGPSPDILGSRTISAEPGRPSLPWEDRTPRPEYWGLVDSPTQDSKGGRTKRGEYPGTANNPGNVEKHERRTDKTLFKGEIGGGRRPRRFAVFSDPVDGLNAAAVTIMRRAADLAKDGKDFTIANYAPLYNPPTENDTAAYVRNLSKYSGIPADEVLDPADAGRMASLLRNVVRFESGYPHSEWFTDDEYAAAAGLMKEGPKTSAPSLPAGTDNHTASGGSTQSHRKR